MTKIFQRFGGVLLAVVMAAGGFTSCDLEEEDTGPLFLSVSPSKVLFSRTATSQNVIEINTNSSWNITVDDSGLVLSAMSGKAGIHNVTVLGMDEGQTYKAAVTTTRTGSDGNPVTRIVTVATGTFNWAELPETLKESVDYKYIKHYSKTITSKKDVRNYSACYDTRRHNPMYVAFPYHAIYREGGMTRTDPDPWRPDPEMTEAQQSIIYQTDWADWPWNGKGGFVSWTYYNGSYSLTRGHLMRSAERGAGSATAEAELNVQTFYPTNIAPERYKYYSHWEAIELIMPDNWMCADTVYCVVGCHYATDNHTTRDASNGSRSKQVVIPTARYKIFMRTKAGNTGKSIAQCNANQVMAIGFWFEQNFGAEITAAPALRTIIYSVDDIEKMTGGIFDFFPQAPEGVTGTYNIDEWPGLSAIAN